VAKRKQSKKRKARPNTLKRLKPPDSVKGEQAEALFDRIAEEILHGDRALFESLTPYERSLVTQWMSEAIITGDAHNAVHDVLWEIDFHKKPVDIETFITNDYYLGRVLEGLDQNWVDDLKKVFAPGSKIFEWIMTGAIGIGKTTLAMVALAYKLHYLSCLRDAPTYYGLLKESLIVFGIYSITKLQVSDTGYYKLRGYVDNSPYFRLDFPRSRKIDSQLDFERSTEKKIKVVPGSQDLHALGLDLYSFSMDEVNFMREKSDKDKGRLVGQAYDLYNAVHTRITSRFIRPGGSIPGIMVLMSSRNAQTSFLESHIQKVGGTEMTYISDYALWEVKPKHKFSLPTFKVEVGDRVSSSRILGDGEKSRADAKIIEVPGEFEQPFLEDIDQALRDIAGVATFNVSPLVRDRKSVFDMVRKNIPNPFTKPIVTIDVEDDITLDQFFEMRTVCRIRRGKWEPRLNPTRPRFAHVDLSLSGDCAGIAMGHVSGIIRHQRLRPDGATIIVENPFIIIDFMVRIAPPPSSEIDLSKIRSFILFLKDIYPLTRVTFDGFQSADSIQILRKAPHKVEAGLLSVDKNDEPYLSLRSALFDRRIGGYRYDPFVDEVLDLQRYAKTKKVDHPIRATKGGKGSKDVSDSVAGVVWTCINDERASAELLPMPEEQGRKRVRTVDPDEKVVSTEIDSQGRVVEPEDKPKGRLVGGRLVDRESLRKNVQVP
jgi:hypothetical protein